MVAEGFTRLTYEIDEGKGGVTKLTLTHELEGEPQLALLMSGGLEDDGRRRRLDLGAQRPQVAARDRLLARLAGPAQPGLSRPGGPGCGGPRSVRGGPTLMTFQAYIDNIEAKTGKTPDDFRKLAEEKGLLKPDVKAGQIVDWLNEDSDLGRGHAMAIYATLKPHMGK